MLSCNTRILFIASIDARAQFSISTSSEGVHGFFDVSTTVNAGPIGKLHVMVHASADVSAFTYNKKSASSLGILADESAEERRLTISGGSLADTDWDLDVSIDFESEVLDAVGGAVSDAAKAIVKAMEEAREEVDETIGEAVDAIDNLAEDIGEDVADAINAVGDFFGDGLEELEDFFSDAGDLVDDVLTDPKAVIDSVKE